MRMEPRRDLSEAEIRESLPWVIRDATASEVMNTLTSGTLLCALAVVLGASNTVIGLIAGIAPLMQLVQLHATHVVERRRNRKRLALTSAVAARALWLAVAAASLLPLGRSRVGVLLALLALRAGVNAYYICSSNSWVRDLVPDRTMGDFYARRMSSAYLAGLLTGVAAGWIIDASTAGRLFGSALGAFAFLFAVATVAGEIAALMMVKVPEPEMPPPSGENLASRLGAPLRDANYRRFLCYLGAWNLTLGIATPLLTVLLLRRLGFPILWVVLLEGAGKAAHLLTLGVWGRLADRHSSLSTVAAAQPLYFATLFVWPLVGWLHAPRAATLALIAAVYVVNRVAAAGISIGNMTLAMQLAPRGGATPYLTLRSLIMNPVTFVAPVAGGAVADLIARVPALARVGGVELTLALAALIGVGCGVLLRGVSQEQSAAPREVRAQFFAQARAMVLELGGALRTRLTRGST
jgi:hypothetical protein